MNLFHGFLASVGRFGLGFCVQFLLDGLGFEFWGKVTAWRSTFRYFSGLKQLYTSRQKENFSSTLGIDGSRSFDQSINFMLCLVTVAACDRIEESPLSLTASLPAIRGGIGYQSWKYDAMQFSGYILLPYTYSSWTTSESKSNAGLFSSHFRRRLK